MIIIYQCRSNYISVDRLDTEQMLVLKPSVFPVVVPKSKSVIAWSMDRRSYRATALAPERSVSIVCTNIPEAQLQYLHEFTESMLEMGVVEIDPEGYSGHEGRYYDRAVITNIVTPFERVGHRLYKFEFTAEIIE